MPPPDNAPAPQEKERRLDAGAQARVRSHLHLTDLLACEQYRRCGRAVPRKELVGEAQLALAYAATRFDEGRGVPFGAYATMVIRHRLAQAVVVWQRWGRANQACFTDLAETGGDGGLLAVNPTCPRTREPAQDVADRELIERVRLAMPPRWFAVLQLYFAQGHTLEEIAGQVGVSRERVRQLVAKGVARARRRLPREALGSAG
jgi:RNA polymerase sigma factor (sigma-70 family)